MAGLNCWPPPAQFLSVVRIHPLPSSKDRAKRILRPSCLSTNAAYRSFSLVGSTARLRFVTTPLGPGSVEILGEEKPILVVTNLNLAVNPTNEKLLYAAF